MKIKWEQGFDRLGYAFIGLCWVIFLFVQFMDFNAYRTGEYLVYMLVFTVVLKLIGRTIKWVFRGFLGGA